MNKCSWFWGGHCWHYVGTKSKPVMCKATGTPLFQFPQVGTHFIVEKCCKCGNTKEREDDHGGW